MTIEALVGHPVFARAFRRMSQALAVGGMAAPVGGCHLSRDTAAAIERVGFAIEQLDRFQFRPPAP